MCKPLGAGVSSFRYCPSGRPRAFLKDYSASNAEGVAGPAQTPRIAKFQWEAIQTGKGKSYMCNPIVQQFLEGSELQGSELDAPASGKRLRVDLAGLSGLLPNKCGRKVGYRKQQRPGDAADASAGSAAGAGWDRWLVGYVCMLEHEVFVCWSTRRLSGIISRKQRAE
jgi:hypothetical protein